MGLPNTVNQLFNGGSPYYIVNRSLRFRSSASAYLNRTPSVAGTRTKFTYSAWVKRGALGINGAIFDAYSDVQNYCILQFFSDNTLSWYNQNGAATITLHLNTTQVFRDPGAWYHILVNYDSTQATSTDRAAIYINGVKVTAFGTATYPSLNTTAWANATVPHDIGRYGGASNYFDGYLAEVNFIDGQALTPSSFGAFDTNGIWQPIKYTGTYGTNGFYLPFVDTSSTTNLVKDASGNGNNWTANNISLTAGVTYDSMLDSPTVSNASSNYAVLNPLRTPASTTISNGNLSMSDSTNNHNYLSTIGMTSGKWYFEFVASASGFSAAHAGIAISTISPDTYIGSDTNGYAYHATTGQVLYNNSALGNYSTWTAGDIIGIAYDANGGNLYVAKNNTWQNSGNPAAGTGAVATGIASNTWFFGIGGNPSALLNANFGQQPFTYTPPSGYNALNTANLPQPLISNGANYMAATLYTGNGTAGRVITVPNINEVGFAWVKLRSGVDDHRLANIVTGGNKHLKSNTTDAESSGTNIIQAFSSNTFTVGNDTSVNANGSTYVGWTWAANGTAVTNNNGTISSQVSANTSAGFSVVTYTGNGTNGATVGHGLGVAPNMILIKNRSSVSSWLVYSSVIGASNFLVLNATDASAASALPFNNTAPTSSVFSLGTSGGTNVNGSNFVAYCFAAVRGYSAMGSYTGNGTNPDGPFVFTGFRPRWVMIKGVNRATLWEMYDTSRNTYNLTNALLDANDPNAESTSLGVSIDILSNGFKIRNPGAAPDNNASGETYVYAAFAENPFSIARAR